MALTSARNAVAADIPAIVRVINAAYRVEDFFVYGDRTSEEDIARRMTGPGRRILVVDADEPGALAAVVCLEISGGRGHFAMLSVDPAHQRKGLAGFLIGTVDDHCRAAGCHALDLEVVDLREELPPFYEAMGFVRCGTAEFSDTKKLRREAHLILMTRPLLPKYATEVAAE